MAAIATRPNECIIANLELGENKEEDGNNNTKKYIWSVILLILFNVACITLFIFVYQLSDWNEQRINLILKVATTLVSIFAIVMFSRMRDFSKDNYNFYYI